MRVVVRATWIVLMRTQREAVDWRVAIEVREATEIVIPERERPVRANPFT